MTKHSMTELIPAMMQTPGYLSLDQLGVLKNFYTLYLECITVELTSIHGELTELNMMGEYNIVKNKLETIEWYVGHQKNKLNNLFKTYFENPSELVKFDPNVKNNEFYQVYKILTNNPEHNKQYRNFSIIQRISEVGDEVIELFRDMAKKYE